MREKLKRKLCVALIGLLVFAASVNVSAFAAQDGAVWSEYSLPQTMQIGATLGLPDVTVTYNGQSEKAKAVIYSPDGNARELKAFTPDSAGAYTIEFRAVIGGKLFSRRSVVSVGQSIVAASLPTDTVEYKENTAAGKAGIEAKITSGSTLKINQTVDLRRFSSSVPLVEAYVVPQTAGQKDFAALRVELSDAYASSNKVVIYYVANDDEKDYCTVYAGAGAATAMGYSQSDGALHSMADGNGSVIATSFYGGENSLSVRYDNIANTVYGAARTDGKELGGVTLSSFIADVSSGAFDVPFSGFRTGEINISITPYNYTGDGATIVITDVAGIDLKGNFFAEPVVPVITVDYDGYSINDIPYALAGKPYKLFSATSSRGDIERRVYRDYYTSSCVEFEITDDCFTPDRAGNYSLVFSVKDNYGNPVETVVPVRTLSESDFSKAEYADLKLSTSLESDAALTVPTGLSVKLPVQSYSGGIGKVTAYVTASLAGGEETEITGGAFTPKKSGKYTLSFYAKDRAGQVAKTALECTATVNKDPVFLSEPILPKYFVAGKKYTLPTVSAVRYGDADLAVEPAIAATGGSVDGNVFTADNKDTVAKIRYVAVADTGSSTRAFDIPVVSVIGEAGKLDLGKYFYASNLTGTPEGSHVMYSVTSTSADHGSIEFINRLLAEYFTLEFFVPETANDFTTLDVVLTDGDNAGETAFLRFTKASDDKVRVSVNGKGASYPVSVPFAGNAETNYYSVGYDAEKLAFTIDGRSISIGETSGGATFNGFSSGKVYLTVKLGGVSGASAVGVKRVNNQIITKIASDTIVPQIVFADMFGMYRRDTEFLLPAAMALDVLDPEITFTVTVRDADDNIVIASDGTALENADPTRDYKFTLSNDGTYGITYTATDSTGRVSGRSARYVVGINVIDDVAPVIRISSVYKTNVKVGETLNFATAEVTDNADDAPIHAIFVKNPDGRIEMQTGAGYTFARAGVYELTHYAIDASGNSATLKFTITAA